MLANHGMWTDFDNSAIGGAAGNITVDANNLDDIVRGVKREIREANGKDLMKRNGVFIIWRAADFEILEQVAQAIKKTFGLVKSFLIYGENPAVGNALQAS